MLLSHATPTANLDCPKARQRYKYRGPFRKISKPFSCNVFLRSPPRGKRVLQGKGEWEGGVRLDGDEQRDQVSCVVVRRLSGWVAKVLVRPSPPRHTRQSGPASPRSISIMIVEPLHINLDVIDPSVSPQAVNKLITLVNVEGQRVAFKIRTTARTMFSTTPNCGLLEPGEEIDIHVTMVAFPPEKYAEVTASMACSEKFLVRSAPAADTSEEIIRGEASAVWWEERPKTDITDQIVTCSYVRQVSACAAQSAPAPPQLRCAASSEPLPRPCAGNQGRDRAAQASVCELSRREPHVGLLQGARRGDAGAH